MWNERFSETELISTFVAWVLERLPETWSANVAYSADLVQKPRPDALITLNAPDGTGATILVEVKTALRAPQLSHAIDQLRAYVRSMPVAHPLLIAPYLSPAMRERLREAGIGYADATGNLRLRIDRPAVFLESQGADVNPWPEKRSLLSLKGPAAGRVVRGLCDFRPPYGVREFAERIGSSPATVSRTATMLEAEGIVARNSDGSIGDVDWEALIRRWVRDYSLMQSNQIGRFLEPRGRDELLAKLRMVTQRYAITGSFAAARIAPFAEPRLGMLYVENIPRFRDVLKLEAVETGANVWLIEPFDPVAFERSSEDRELRYAAASQAAADLLTSPGRGPSEGEWLLRWMRENDRAWRS